MINRLTSQPGVSIGTDVSGHVNQSKRPGCATDMTIRMFRRKGADPR